MFLRHCFSILFLFSASITGFAKPVEKCEKDKEGRTVYVAWARPKTPLPPGSTSSPQGIEQPLRQNGTWIDVGVWEHRKDVISTAPFLFTIQPGHDSNTRTIVQKDTSKKLAYSSGDISLPVNYGSLAAFILTEGVDSETRVVDGWTVEKDGSGRMLLGLVNGEGSGSLGLGGVGGSDWTAGGCAWISPDAKLCDGFYFMNGGGRYGTPVVIEVVEWRG